MVFSSSGLSTTPQADMTPARSTRTSAQKTITVHRHRLVLRQTERFGIVRHRQDDECDVLVEVDIEQFRPFKHSSRSTARANALSFIFFRTDCGVTSATALLGRTNATAVMKPVSSSTA